VVARGPAGAAARWLALVVLAVVGYAWWRHSIFNCARGQCLLPEQDAAQSDAGEGRSDR
jgi:cbb3-type cytochrome oxidase subunit 3